jgi:hypothetical protein
MNFAPMAGRNCVVTGLLLPFFLAGLVGSAPAPRRRDTEADLLARIGRELNLVKRAKLEVRLGRVKLFQATEAYDRGDVEECYQLLAAYLERMRGAWATLQSSGRQAWRQDQGFRELDIALREDGRYLDDFKRRVPFQNRAPAEKVAKEVDELRNQVLKALFPPEHLRKKTGRSAPNPLGAFSVGMIQR